VLLQSLQQTAAFEYAMKKTGYNQKLKYRLTPVYVAYRGLKKIRKRKEINSS